MCNEKPWKYLQKKKSMLKKVVWNGKGNNEKYIT